MRWRSQSVGARANVDEHLIAAHRPGDHGVLDLYRVSRLQPGRAGQSRVVEKQIDVRTVSGSGLDVSMTVGERHVGCDLAGRTRRHDEVRTGAANLERQRVLPDPPFTAFVTDHVETVQMRSSQRISTGAGGGPGLRSITRRTSR